MMSLGAGALKVSGGPNAISREEEEQLDKASIRPLSMETLMGASCQAVSRRK